MTPPTPKKVVGLWRSLGAALLMMLLPPLVYGLWAFIEYSPNAALVPRSTVDFQLLLEHVPRPTLPAAAMFLGWFAFQALLQIYAPGPWVLGTELKGGGRLAYKMNGWLSWWFTWACLVGGVLCGVFSPAVLADNLGPLMAVANVFAFALSGYLFLHGRRHGAGEEVSGLGVYDYFLGAAKNPRIRRFDWKLFCEARPGLMAWVAIDLSLAAKQHQLYGSLSTPMVLVCAFQAFYVADYYFNEEAILGTWDIKHENFGWMLCWGDLVWVPFIYTIQAHYLVRHGHDLPAWAAAGVVILNVAGYVIFRGSNLQKHRFRKDPAALVWGKPPALIETAQGSLLLVSGFWGLARHVNYLGDLMMGLAWCLVCGFHAPLPYFFIVYFTILLLHRERRDHAMCASKYGSDWDAYCARVKSRIMPALY